MIEDFYIIYIGTIMYEILSKNFSSMKFRIFVEKHTKKAPINLKRRINVGYAIEKIANFIYKFYVLSRNVRSIIFYIFIEKNNFLFFIY